MRAVISAELGAAAKLAEVPTPSAGPGEVRVKVAASSLNGFDAAVISGYLAALIEHRFPVVLGRDFAGAVDQLGDGVDGFAVGDAVFGVVLTFPLHAGGFGEYVVVPAASLARVPDGLDLTTAGALGLAGAAAATVVDAIAPQPGEIVLIAGATGGVGSIAVQLAAARGAVVLATAEPGAGTQLVRRLGAHYVIDRTGDIIGQVAAIAPGGVKAAVHLAGDPFALAELIAPGGRFTTLLGVGQDQMGVHDVVALPVNADLAPAGLEDLAAQVVAGRVEVPVQRIYHLEEVPQAFADFAAGSVGKLAVRIG
ncbi:NADP-dependent oxidoreductase [Catellatospora citrea]|uniref:NADPH:quinone reductase n=1 Tax=Catellatospora citrea TaxID=53366 RepID=A0A8J3KMX3_9ACTN|nr:NADP-dependent oxidoreductase [Catellatospora citrea]RKE11491.1 NADPH:quinone reductase-like Zn-dependent oxidoreductase [Catellatospora citrea]GIF99990.1 NADPH:quinone reductase [Catellatospora citrea]